MSDDIKKTPLTLFGDLNDVPVTPAGKRDVAALDELAETHGFKGGAEAKPRREEGRGVTPRATTSKKLTKARKNDDIKVRRIGRPKTGRTVPFSQTVHPGYANGLYDYCRRNGTTVTVALERSLRALLENELREARRQGNDDAALVEIQETLEELPREA